MSVSPWYEEQLAAVQRQNYTLSLHLSQAMSPSPNINGTATQ
jgi:hypothetical protein